MNEHISVIRSNTILYSRQWPEVVRFYRDVMEFATSMENDWFVEFRLTDHSFLSVVDVTRTTQSRSQSSVTLSLQVPDIDMAYEYIVSENVPTEPIKLRFGSSSFFCFDPDHNRIELWQAADQ